MTSDIVVAPAGYLVSDQTGTDAGIPYELLRRLSVLLNEKVYAIANRIEVLSVLPANLKFIEIKEDKGGGLLEQVMFLLKLHKQAKELLKHKPRVIHHMSTFLYGGSFNTLAISGNLDNIPFIIGPAEYHPPAPKELLSDSYYHRWGRHWTDMASVREVALRKTSSKLLKGLAHIKMNWFIKTLEKCDVLIATNQITRERFRKFLSGKRIRVIPLGVDTRHFSPSPVPKNNEILFLGRLSKTKGAEYIIRAMPQIIKQFNNSKLHIVGDGPQRLNLMKLSKDLGVSSNVIFHGYVSHDKIPIYYRMCRVVCVPSVLEAFGLVTLEVMASGRPVVATKTTGSREIVKDGVTGFLVPIANSDAIAEAIIRLLSDYELSSKMGSESRRIAERKYSWDVVVNQYYSVYREFL